MSNDWAGVGWQYVEANGQDEGPAKLIWDQIHPNVPLTLEAEMEAGREVGIKASLECF